MAASSKLLPTLGTFDLVLLNIAAIVGLRWLSAAAQLGPAGLTLWVIASIAFFIPSGLAVQELSSRMPREGGLYLWIREAFGDIHGFVAAWGYVLSNLVFFPSLLLFISGVLLHIGSGSWLALAESPVYNGAVCLTLLWVTTLLNILGLERAKLLQNVGGIGTLVIAVLVLAGGALAWWRFGAATPIHTADLLPDWSALPTFSTLAMLILGYLGLELGPIMGDEIKDSARTIRRATFIAGIAIAGIYVAGTAALLVALPPEQIGAISGIPSAMAAIGDRLGVLHMGAITAMLLAIANVGGLSGWVGGTARLPFVMGMGHYLPERLSTLHPRYATPHVALLTQAAVTSVVILLAVAGSAIHEAYVLLIDMTVAINCVVWMYIFASLFVLRRRARGKDSGIAVIPGGPVVCALVAGVGFVGMALALVASLMPPASSENPLLFVLKGVGGCVLLFATGLVIARRGQRRMLARA
ncbi:MAG: APC family permease [Pseudomonadota bacterium]